MALCRIHRAIHLLEMGGGGGSLTTTRRLVLFSPVRYASSLLKEEQRLCPSYFPSPFVCPEPLSWILRLENLTIPWSVEIFILFLHFTVHPVAKFLVPDWWIYSWLRHRVFVPARQATIGLSYRPASLCSLTARYDNPMPEATISTIQGLKIWLYLPSQNIYEFGY